MGVVIRVALVLSAGLLVAGIFLELSELGGKAEVLLILASALAVGTVILILWRQGRAHRKLVAAVSNLSSELAEIRRLLNGLTEQVELESKSVREAHSRSTSLPEWSTEKWERLYRRLAPGKSSIEQRARSLVTRDVNALLTLHHLVQPGGEPPRTTGYAATPETILALVGLVPELPPEAVIVETGSGLSTVWLALAAEQFQRPLQLISLEQDGAYAEATRAALTRQRLSSESRVDVRLAPLTATRLDGHEQPWYAPESYADISRIDVLFVDGPTASTGKGARYPAVPLFEDRFVDGAVIILDDVDREDEQEILERWLSRSERGVLTVERELDRAVLLRYSLDQR